MKEDQCNISVTNIIPNKVLEPDEIVETEEEVVKLADSIGRVAKEVIAPYPPGIPLVWPGEEIGSEIIEIIKGYISNNKTVFCH